MFKGKAISVSMHDAGIAELRFDLEGESVNKFNALTVQELGQAVEVLEKADGLKGVLVTSGKPVFIVGADITEFGSQFGPNATGTFDKTKDPANIAFNRLEDLHVPTVALINGYAMGGGLELTLTCDFRVMSTVAKIGLPETKLGIIPGWGGTVRLPRIAGADTAIDWIASGKEQRADVALKAGVVDGVVAPDQLQAAGLKVLEQAIAGTMPYAERRATKKGPLKLNQTEAMMAFETSKAFVAGMAGPNYPAPIVAIECMQKAAGMTRDDALQVEAEGFIKVANTPVATSLIGIFMSDQLIAKKAKGWEKRADKKVKSAAVLGAGIMGGGIAYQSALKGVPIKMKDINQAGLDLGLSEATKLLSKAVNRGRMTVEKMGGILSTITRHCLMTALLSWILLLKRLLKTLKLNTAYLLK